MEQSICKTCGGDISLWGPSREDLDDAWWAHVVHPADDHDAVPVGDGDSVIEHYTDLAAAIAYEAEERKATEGIKDLTEKSLRRKYNLRREGE